MAAPDHDPKTTIATHHGTFHADEALAVYMLRKLPQYSSFSLVRSRNTSAPAEPLYLPNYHTVVDVGRIYDPTTNRFDHHQTSFTETFPGRPTKLSSAGLVYMHFGKQLIAQELSAARNVNGKRTSPVEESDPDVELVHKQLYTSFVEALDANDNGEEAYERSQLVPGAQKRFSSKSFTLAAVVNGYNLSWNSGFFESEEALRTAENAQFEKASRWIGGEFDKALDSYLKGWLPARELVDQAFAKRTEHNPDGRIMVLSRPCPWKEWLSLLEKKYGADDQLWYVLYPEMAFESSPWRIQCVSISPDSFVNRHSLPEAWKNPDKKDLDEVTGVSGTVFVHANLFIGGNLTFDGAMQMAQKAVQEQ